MTGKNHSESLKPVYEGYFSKIHWVKDSKEMGNGKLKIRVFKHFTDLGKLNLLVVV